MTERILCQVQGAEVGFLEEFTVWYFAPMRSCAICRTLNVEPLLRIERSQLRWFGHVSRMSQKRLSMQVQLATLTDKRPRGRPKDQVAWLHLRICLVPSWCGVSGTSTESWTSWGISSPPGDAAPATLPRGNAATKMNEWVEMLYAVTQYYIW